MSAQDSVSVPQSPYAEQLQQGFRGLRFARALEREFEVEFGAQHLTRLRLGFAVAIALYGLFMLARLRVETGPAGEWILQLRGAAISGLLVTLAASYPRALRSLLPLLTLTSYGVFGAAVTAIEVIAHRHGIDRHYEGLILLSFHLYMFSGLLLRPALAAGGFILLAYAIGGWAGGLASRAWGYELLFVALTHVIGGAALYSIERVERENFLRRRLFGVLATQDGLTGLYNRMAFFQQFERTARQAAREGVCIGVVLFDLDHFKPYNDRYGHLEGDACLRRVANAVGEEFRRPLDAIGRYGGEEFVGVWYDAPPPSVRTLAEQIRAAVQALRINHHDAPSGRVTISVGAVVARPREGEDLLALIERADRALYDAKEKGRNRVVVEVLPSASQPQRPGARRAPTISGAG